MSRFIIWSRDKYEHNLYIYCSLCNNIVCDGIEKLTIQAPDTQDLQIPKLNENEFGTLIDLHFMENNLMKKVLRDDLPREMVSVTRDNSISLDLTTDTPLSGRMSTGTSTDESAGDRQDILCSIVSTDQEI